MIFFSLFFVFEGNHKFYFSAVSSTYRRDARHFKIVYGTGEVEGHYSTDTLTVKYRHHLQINNCQLLKKTCHQQFHRDWAQALIYTITFFARAI